MADSAYGDDNTGSSVQDTIDFSAQKTFDRLKKLQDYGRKIKDKHPVSKEYQYGDKHPKSGKLDTQLFPGIDRNPKKLEDTDKGKD